MKLVTNPLQWPVLLAALNPEIVEASPNDRLHFTVFLPRSATVGQFLAVTNWFKGHETHLESDDGEGITVAGFAKRDHLRSMMIDLEAAGGAILDTRTP